MPDLPHSPEPATVPEPDRPVAIDASGATDGGGASISVSARSADSVAIATSPPSTCDDDLPQPTGERCGNCNAVLFGEHCYRCGQPDHGLVRHFSSVMGDFADTVLQIDTRLTRTIGPLLLRPGFLTTEYFAGRRVRYVSPVRLFFFLAVIAFFVAQWSVDSGGNNKAFLQADDDSIIEATTVADVQQRRDHALAALRAVQPAVGMVDATADLQRAQRKISEQANARITELRAAEAAGKPPPDHVDTLSFDGVPWDPVSHPLTVRWLPAFANGWLNQAVGKAKDNVRRIRRDPALLLDAWLSALPSTLFVLLPLFALLLKVAYAFKQRLYMEHFIVALHSHAFLCLALLLALLLAGLGDLVQAGWMSSLIGAVEAAIIVWMPVYLWIMQKRVYGQGVIATTLKYGLLGMLYVLLLTFGATLTLLVKLVWL